MIIVIDVLMENKHIMAKCENYMQLKYTYSVLTMFPKQWEAKRQVMSGTVWEGRGSHSTEGDCHTVTYTPLAQVQGQELE